MAQAPSILNADRGRAQATAFGILCLLAAVQVVLILYAISKGGDQIPMVEKGPSVMMLPMEPTMRFSPPPVGQLASATAPPVPSAPTVQSFAPPPIGSFQAPSVPVAPAFPPIVPLVPAVPQSPQLPSAVAQNTAPAAPPLPANAPAQPVAVPGLDMSLQEMVELAKQVRALGDMQGALEVLNRADLQYPSNPEVMAETAQCYEAMGLSDKAASVWRQLEAMDPAQAAGFRDLAQRRLNAPPVAASVPGGLPAFSGAGDKVLSLGACQATKDPSVANGEKVVLRIPILRQGNMPLDPSQVDIDVYFFDRVNGEKVALTIADDPVSSWAAAPVDWSGIGEEPLDVTYFLPTLTPGEVAAHGRRSYHGYVIRLYYQHKLQDVAAEPRDLLDFGSRTPQALPGGVNPLLPPVMN
jgi:hypothetical protein